MSKLILDYVYDKEAAHPERVYLTQPTGAGATTDYTWGRVLDEARRMAAHLQSLGLQPGDRVAILSKNCAHFFMAELAIWIGGYTTVAIFPTESADVVRYVLEHSEAKALFVGKLDTWAAQEPGVPADLPRIAFPLAPKTTFDTWDAVIGRTQPLTGRVARQGDDLAMIIYTSGSTGQPKGVMHSFERVTRATEGIVRGVGFVPGERALSYLPLAHVFERAYIECASFVGGGHIFFAEALDTFVADLKRAQPTLFISVPRLWLKFQQGVFAKLPPKKLDLLLKIPVVRGLIAKKVLTGLGLNKVRLAGSGSAPIPAELITWYRRLGLNLLEGYAMTEDFAFSHLSSVEKNAPGYVGLPYAGVEVRISDELKLTGRVKELFKTAKGKYVAPAPIENRINEHPLVELSCVSGVGQPAAYGMVVLAEDIRGKVNDAAVRADIEAQLTALLAKVNGQIAEYEKLDFLVIAREPFTIENGLLTPTMKIKRARIEAANADHLEGWYSAKKPVLWA